MRFKIIIIIFQLCLQRLVAQNIDVVNWLNTNAIAIENANPDEALDIFKSAEPTSFSNAKIYGFGEATHYTKEFFNIKIKFFKYLVEHENVKVFILEDAYVIEEGLNNWISGGEGNAVDIMKNLTIQPWYCKEVMALFQWIRDYNIDKPVSQQIRCYGMDIQTVTHINTQIKAFIAKYNLTVDVALLEALDKCVARKVVYTASNNWADTQLPKLNALEEILINFDNRDLSKTEKSDVNEVLRALQYLNQYTYYVQHSYSHVRDQKMFENVQYIVTNKAANGKAFIWAHNEHVNNYGVANYNKRGVYNLGKYLKEFYNEEYYSVGFDFGTGEVTGFYKEEGKILGLKKYLVKEPYAKTYAETLHKVKYDIFFIPMDEALKSSVANFFTKKQKQLLLSIGDYTPDKVVLYQKKYSEMYDAILFVKNITLADYKLVD